MAIVLMAMSFNTAVPTLYSFTARFVTVDTTRFRIAAIVVGAAAFGLGRALIRTKRAQSQEFTTKVPC